MLTDRHPAEARPAARRRVATRDVRVGAGGVLVSQASSPVGFIAAVVSRCWRWVLAVPR